MYLLLRNNSCLSYTEECKSTASCSKKDGFCKRKCNKDETALKKSDLCMKKCRCCILKKDKNKNKCKKTNACKNEGGKCKKRKKCKSNLISHSCDDGCVCCIEGKYSVRSEPCLPCFILISKHEYRNLRVQLPSFVFQIKCILVIAKGAPMISDNNILVLVSDGKCTQPLECRENNGVCSKTCSGDERELKDLCYSDNTGPPCKCCAPKCSQDTACTLWGGTCVDGEEQCPTKFGTHMVTADCTGYNCVCCKPGK